MNYTFKENQLDYETYYILRKSIKWNNWSRNCFWNILRKICVLEVVLVYNLYLSQTKNSFI